MFYIKVVILYLYILDFSPLPNKLEIFFFLFVVCLFIIFKMMMILFLFIYLFLPHRTACGILVPQPGIGPVPTAVKARSPNHWTAGEFPAFSFFLTLSSVRRILNF